MRYSVRLKDRLASPSINTGSLFPGLEGACEELKKRNFES